MAIPLLTSIAAAQGKQPETAPIPTQIVAAKRVFIANAGGEEPSLNYHPFDGGVDRAYNQFYAAMKSGGRYELVGSPAEADLLFEIRFTLPPDSRFRLKIRDPKTNGLLWALNEPMEWANLQSNRNKNFDQAVGRIVADVQNLATRAAGPTMSAKPR